MGKEWLSGTEALDLLISLNKHSHKILNNNNCKIRGGQRGAGRFGSTG